ncbi:MAG TPA: endopeptidase La [Longimicrobiaceae bacterium]|nr:endopeptidase La [Longimicrobiaceae bacterium]
MSPFRQTSQLPDRILLLPVRSTVVFPQGATALQIGYEPNVAGLNAHPDPDLIVAIVSIAEEASAPDAPLDPASMQKVAVMARVLDRLNLPGGTVQATLQGLWRVQLEDVRLEEGGYYTAAFRRVEETPAGEAEAEQLIERILSTVAGVAAKVERIPNEVPRILRMNLGDPSRFADLAASLSHLNVPDRDAVLQRLDVADRLRYVLERLEDTWERVQTIEEEDRLVGNQAAEAAARTPADRRTQIRKRIRALQTELGEIDPAEREADDILRRADRARLPARVAAVARRETERLRAPGTSLSEAAEIRNYLELLLSVPWTAKSGSTDIDLDAVERAMAEEHLGLEEVARRVLEVLAVARLRGDLTGLIPCLVGPPGVGKATLASAIARGLGRPLARLELGGRGEALLMGSRRTRAGAQPGKLLTTIRDAGVRDPVFLLEEMDELGLGNVEGDPIEAMEEFLDAESRDGFTDRYLDLPLDLSGMFVVATASDFFRIPRDLRDYFIEIRIAGYTPEEKVTIARERLFPRMLVEHGFEPGDVTVSDEVLLFLTRGYARDAGLGNLRRSLASIFRWLARARAEGEVHGPELTREMIEEVLGYPRYISTAAESAPEVGVVTGLAWTASGGELMFIEALKMPGTGRLIITGLLGDVMRESVNAAYSYVRSRAQPLGITQAAFNDNDIHVHFPLGATPKDGPSAGAAVTLAIASSLSDRPVRHDVAMTGEVTLRGKVLEIGGVKEKTLAAYRAGLREVILPSGNRRDLRDVPEDVREGMTFHFVERMDEVFDLCLLEKEARRERRRGGPSRGSAEPQAASDAEGDGDATEAEAEMVAEGDGGA